MLKDGVRWVGPFRKEMFALGRFVDLILRAIGARSIFYKWKFHFFFQKIIDAGLEEGESRRDELGSYSSNPAKRWRKE